MIPILRLVNAKEERSKSVQDDPGKFDSTGAVGKCGRKRSSFEVREEGAARTFLTTVAPSHFELDQKAFSLPIDIGRTVRSSQHDAEKRHITQ